MKPANYILINETSTQNAHRVIRYSHLSNIRHHIIVDNCERKALIRQIVHLRLLYPEAKILGLSEINRNGICPNEKMNALRRELSDLP